MTVVVALQLLVAILAGLLLLESKLNHRNAAISRSIGSDLDDAVDFHPELLARWDDEAAYAQPRPCTRPRTRHREALRGPDDTHDMLRPQIN